MAWIVASVVTLFQLGCASTATMTAMKPAAVDLGNVRRIAVLDFAGPRDVAQVARQAIVSQLSKDEYLAIVDPREFEEFAETPLQIGDGRANVQAAIEAARRMDLDGIVVGQLSRRRHSRFGSSSTVLIGDPIVTVSIEFRLIDVRSGTVLASNRAEQSHTGELEPDSIGPESEQQVIQSLVTKCAAEAIGEITPHETPVRVQLASPAVGKGALAIRAGNKLARRGDWAAARQRWQEALSANPESAAATYNLALASEDAGDFDEAARMYTAAASLGESELSQESLQRVERHRADYGMAMAQIRRQPPAASVMGLASGPTEPPTDRDPAPLVSPYSLLPQHAVAENMDGMQLIPPANAPQAASWSGRPDMMRLPPL